MQALTTKKKTNACQTILSAAVTHFALKSNMIFSSIYVLSSNLTVNAA